MSTMRFVTDLSKGILGSPDSLELWTNVIDCISDEMLLMPGLRILVVACGHGTEATALVHRMIALGVDKTTAMSSIYMLDKYRVFTHEAVRRSKGYYNVILADFLSWTTNMKFDIVIGNPPYQDGDRKDQANKLWPQFVVKGMELLNDGGVLAMITPASWMTPSADIGKGKTGISIFNHVMKVNWLSHACVDSDMLATKYFTGVGSTFSWYIIHKEPAKNRLTTIITASSKDNIDISTIASLPTVFSVAALSINDKMLNQQSMSFNIIDQSHEVSGGGSNGTASSITRDTNFTYKNYHTSAGGGTYRFSEKEHSNARSNKVMMSLSGTYKAVPDYGTVGYTGMNLVLLCSSAEEATTAASVLNSKLYRFVVNNNKFSGFNPRKVMLHLPAVDLNRPWTDAELYDHFNLALNEIDLIEAAIK